MLVERFITTNMGSVISFYQKKICDDTINIPLLHDKINKYIYIYIYIYIHGIVNK